MDNHSRIASVRVGNSFPDDTTPAVKYHLGDHLSSSNVVLDDSGSLVNREEYTPYGETSFGSFARKRYRFAGKERDEESGLNYHGARYYASWLGRWTSCDPPPFSIPSVAREPQKPRTPASLYSGMGNSPIMRIDSDGRQDTGYTKSLDRSFATTEGAEQILKSNAQLLSRVADAWKGFKASWNKNLEKSRQETEKQVGPPGPPTPIINEIIDATPSASSNLWLIFVGALKVGPTIPIAARPLSTAARASTIYNRIVEALRTAEGKGTNPPLAEFQKAGMVAVARVPIAGKIKVYVGIKVPKGAMGAIEGGEAFPTKEVGEWVKKNALKEGEELAGVTASRTHAEGPVKDAIVRDAKAAGIDPATVEGEIGAATDVCHGCQTTLGRDLPNVKPENPAQ